MRKITPQPPETMRQAKTWENVKTRYMALGLCEKCAAQAAWGHQTHADSWTQLHPPCDRCAPFVAELPAPTPNPRWRKVRRGDTILKTSAVRNDEGDLVRPQSASTATPQDSNEASIGCGGCNNRWTGLAVCHCGACHQTFTGISAFDRHRIGSHAKSTRRCANPAERGLVPVVKQYWSGWGLPGERPPR